MLLHSSYVVRDPQQVAGGLARMLLARSLRAPSPPFPPGSWFVTLGDCNGSLLELLPWGSVFDPNVRGMAHDAEMRSYSGSHVLMSTPRTSEEVIELARELSWRAQVVETGLFELIKVWVENRVLIEFLTPEQFPRYAAHFGLLGREQLADKLAELEAQLHQSLAREPSP